MAVVRRFVDPHAKLVGEALEILMKKHREGRLPSFLFITEEVGNPKPLYGLVGRFRSDPAKAIGHLNIMREKVTDFAASQAADLDDPQD